MILFAVIFSIMLLFNPVAGAISVSAGEVAPDFTLSSLDHNYVSLSDYKDKTVVLLYWRTDHKRSLLAIKDCRDVLEKFKGKNIEIVSMIADSDDKEAALKIVKENSIKFPVLIDADRKVYSTYGIRVYPTTVIIDSKGMIDFGIPSHALTYKKALEGHLRKAIGEIDETQLENELTNHRKEVDEGTLESERRYNLALKFIKSGLIDAAIDTVEKSIKAKPELIDPHILLGFLYIENKDADAALAAFDDALKINAHSNDARTGKGGALVMKGDADAAIEILNAASVANPYPHMTYYELGKAYELKGDKDQSVKMYKKAIEKIIHKQILPSSISKCK